MVAAPTWPGIVLLLEEVEGAWNNGVWEKRSFLGGDLMNLPDSSWAAKQKLIWVKIKMTHNSKIALLVVLVVVVGVGALACLVPLALAQASEGTIIVVVVVENGWP